mgnify:CR=1 FL=1
MISMLTALKLRKYMVLAFLFAIPASILVFLFTKSEDITMVFFIAISLVIFLVNIFVAGKKCPSCGKFFFGKQIGIFVLWIYSGNQCANCGYEVE